MRQTFNVLMNANIITDIRLSIPSLDYYNERDERLTDVLKNTCSFNHGNKVEYDTNYLVLDFTVVDNDIDSVLRWFEYTFHSIFPRNSFDLYINNKPFKEVIK